MQINLLKTKAYGKYAEQIHGMLCTKMQHLADKDTEKFVIENSERVPLKNFIISVEELKDLLSREINTITLPLKVYLDSEIRNWNIFKEASARDILTKGLIGTIDNINFSVRKLNNDKAAYVTKKTLDEINAYCKDKYLEKTEMMNTDQLVKLNQKLKGHIFSAHGIKSEVIGTLPNEIAIVKMFPYNADEYFAFVSSKLIKDKTHY